MERNRQENNGHSFAKNRVQSRWVDKVRGHLPAVLVNNLSRRVSKRALWEVFNQYGAVMDIFISFCSRKPSTFAFVRYRWESECCRAIEGGNQRVIDGRTISVRRVVDEQDNRKKQSGAPRYASQNAKMAEGFNYMKTRDDRSFKEVLLETFNKRASYSLRRKG
ncbi:hypothetical protein PTKIN_Ptkin03bG0137100 [Pterospermum kingtungense]